MNSEIKPVYQRHFQFDDWEDVSEEAFNREWAQSKYKTRILYPAAALEALQAENAELKKGLDLERMRLTACGVAALENTKNCVDQRIGKVNPYYSGSYSSVCRAVDEEIRLRDENAAQAKRIEQQLEAIEATANFARDFWQQADKKSETRVMVTTFKELERKLRTYLSAQKGTE